MSLVYYRKDDNELKYLDLDASIEELVVDSELIADKWVEGIMQDHVACYL